MCPPSRDTMPKVPWNTGKLVGQKPPLKFRGVGDPYPAATAGRRRDLALLNLAVDSKLGACDLVALRVYNG